MRCTESCSNVSLISNDVSECLWRPSCVGELPYITSAKMWVSHHNLLMTAHVIYRSTYCVETTLLGWSSNFWYLRESVIILYSICNHTLLSAGPPTLLRPCWGEVVTCDLLGRICSSYNIYVNYIMSSTGPLTVSRPCWSEVAVAIGVPW